MKNNTGTGLGICLDISEKFTRFQEKAFVVSELCSKNLQRGGDEKQPPPVLIGLKSFDPSSSLEKPDVLDITQ